MVTVAPCPEEADVSGDGSTTTNILELKFLVNYIIRSGLTPGTY